MSDRPGNWLALARRVGLVYAAAAGVGSAAVVGLLISVRRRTRCVGCVRQRVRTSLFAWVVFSLSLAGAMRCNCLARLQHCTPSRLPS